MPSPSSTATQMPTARPDAGTPKPTPSASATHTSPVPTQSPPPTTKWPTRPAYHDAGPRPTSSVEPPSSADAAVGGCKSFADCDLNRPFCQVETGKCFRCLGDLTCGGLHCDSTIDECVCTTSNECRFSNAVCDTVTRQCLAPCSSSAQCAGAARICDVAHSVCVECLTSADCAGKSYAGVPVTLCHRAFCVQCEDDSHCAAPKPRCETHDGVCVECLRSDDCANHGQCIMGRCLTPPPTGTP